MKKTLLFFVAIALLCGLTVNSTSASEAADLASDREARMEWWREARFGMFVHWGLYSIPAGQWEDQQWKKGGVEWIQQRAGVPGAVYEKTLVPQFDPKNDFAEGWAEVAKTAGCRYLVFTSKHHEGFSLHDSKLTTYDAMDACGRDLFKEIVDATKAEGLKVGAYHSVIDWHHPHAYAGFGLPTVKGDKNEGRDNSKYVNYLHGQVEEIMSGYGPIDIVWWDYSKELCQGESWRAKELIALVRKHQPQIVMNNRLYRTVEAGWPKGSDWSNGFSIDPQFGDFCTPEQKIPSDGVEGVDWETCMTMNTSWGFNQYDINWKSKETLIRTLVDVVSKGGNYLLNVGPEADGSIPQASIERMEAIGNWMAINGEAIYGTQASPFDLPEWGRYTKKPGMTFAHVFEWPESQTIRLEIGETQIARVYLLSDKEQSELRTEQDEKGLTVYLPKDAPDAVASVLAIEHK